MKLRSKVSDKPSLEQPSKEQEKVPNFPPNHNRKTPHHDDIVSVKLLAKSHDCLFSDESVGNSVKGPKRSSRGSYEKYNRKKIWDMLSDSKKELNLIIDENNELRKN